jgi:hypothetical protein
MEFQPTKEQITLHGLGFLQVILPANQRIHVWHPDLPKRKCFESSSIHDHRFGFISKVLIGTQINQLYREENGRNRFTSHVAYLHEGERTKFGNRPWVEDYFCNLVQVGSQRIINAGEQYEMNPYMLHSTKCEGVCVTLMTKTHSENIGAHSYCRIGFTPDVDFDRKQCSQNELWEIFTEAMKLANL